MSGVRDKFDRAFKVISFKGGIFFVDKRKPLEI